MAVTTKTFAVGEKYHHFVVDGKKYQAGHYDYNIDVNGIVTITRLVGGNVTAPIVNQHWNTLINAATGVAFANKAAFETWLADNFFF